VSAVSLDEEMIQLMKYQHAFSAASKLLTTTDEMLNTLIAMR
jgi:flagellar hook-associated protein 1 FlgK